MGIKSRYLAVAIAVAGLFLVPLGYAQMPAPSADGVLEGVITHGTTTKPIVNAYVAITAGNDLYFSATSDGNGRYTLRDLPAATFRMQVEAEGYLSPPNIRLDVGSQQRVRRDVMMTAMASIRGRIVNANREPLADLQVQVLQQVYDVQGRPQWRTLKTETTNDQGEYHSTYLAPGDYYVRAVRKSSADSLAAVTFFPGTVDVRSAAKIGVREGGEGNASFAVAEVKTYSVSGILTGLDPNSAATVRLYLLPQDSKIPRDTSSGYLIDRDVAGVPQNFRLRGILPGAYDLFAQQGLDRLAKLSIEVRDADLENLSLILDSGVDVRGRIRIAGHEDDRVMLKANGGFIGPLSFSTDTLTGQALFLLQRRDGFMTSAVSRHRDDETFSFPSLAEGVYNLNMSLFDAARFYLADIRQDGRSVFDDGLRVSRNPIDSLEIILGIDGVTLAGTVLTEKNSPLLVVLAPPPERRQNPALYKTHPVTASSQSFRFEQVAPGRYKLFAFELESLDETIPFRNTDFLSLYETQGVSVSAEKGVSPPIRVPLIRR